MKFAYLILGEFVYPQDSAAIHGETAQIIGVSNLEEACAAAKKLAATAWAASSFAVQIGRAHV